MSLLSTRAVQEQTGFSLQKIQFLIRIGKLAAINTSAGKRPTWFVRQEDLDEMLTPRNGKYPTNKPAKRQRIDANVEKVFG